MYKGSKIKDLLKERKISAKELLDYLGVKDNGTIARFTGPDIKASRLEQIADFFGVSVEYFFERTEGDINIAVESALATRGGHAEYHSGTSSKVRELSAKIKLLESELDAKEAAVTDKERIIQEKEERIKLLEKLLKALEEK